MKIGKIKLSRLRDIGWSLWDPIGLLGKEEHWDDESFADEYDNYLLEAAGSLKRNVPANDVVKYLMWVESEHMGLGPSLNILKRAQDVVDALQ